MPRLERRAAHVPGAAELVADYEAWLAVDGRGSTSYRNAAWSFLARWPDPAAFADETLAVQESLGVAQRPFVTYLMATCRLHPGYDYLTHKIGGLLTHASRGPLAGDISTFTSAAAELDYSAHTVRCATERVIVRLLIQTGRPLTRLNAVDLDELAAALHRRAQTTGKPTAWPADRAMLSTAHRVLFHLGILDTPPPDPRCRPGLRGRYSGVPDPLRTVLEDYCTQAAATRAPATVKAIASHLADFGRFLAACDPPVTDLAALDRPHRRAVAGGAGHRPACATGKPCHRPPPRPDPRRAAVPRRDHRVGLARRPGPHPDLLPRPPTPAPPTTALPAPGHRPGRCSPR